jgi:hypothetical protein
VELLAGEQLEPAREHVQVAALCYVGVVFVRDAAIARLGHDAFRLTPQPVRLGVEGVFESEGLTAVENPFLVVGVGAFHGVAQQHDQSQVRSLACGTPGREGVEQVVGARFTTDHGSDSGACQVVAGDHDGKVRAVPARTAGELRVEVVDALDVLAAGEHRGDRRMLEQVSVQRGGAAALGPDDGEVGQRPHAGGDLAVAVEKAFDRVAGRAVGTLHLRVHPLPFA